MPNQQLSDAERDEKVNAIKSLLHPLDASEAELIALYAGFEVSQEVSKTLRSEIKTTEDFRQHLYGAVDHYLEVNPFIAGGVH